MPKVREKIFRGCKNNQKIQSQVPQMQITQNQKDYYWRSENNGRLQKKLNLKEVDTFNLSFFMTLKWI
jgi:hypothetical protein